MIARDRRPASRRAPRRSAARPPRRHARDRPRPRRRRPRDQAALRPRMARAGRDVIGVEQEREALVEGAIAGRDAAAAGTVSKNHVVCARCHLVGLASGID